MNLAASLFAQRDLAPREAAQEALQEAPHKSATGLVLAPARQPGDFLSRALSPR